MGRIKIEKKIIQQNNETKKKTKIPFFHDSLSRMCVHIQITSKQHFHTEDDDQRKKNDDAKLDEREKKKKI